VKARKEEGRGASGAGTEISLQPMERHIRAGGSLQSVERTKPEWTSTL